MKSIIYFQKSKYSCIFLSCTGLVLVLICRKMEEENCSQLQNLLLVSLTLQDGACRSFLLIFCLLCRLPEVRLARVQSIAGEQNIKKGVAEESSSGSTGI